MNLSALLESNPSVPRRFVHYLEAKGFISPEKVWKQRIARRDYSQQDANVVHETWRYYDRGYSIQAAYELAVRQERPVAWVRMQVDPRDWGTVTESLGDHPGVVRAEVVYGGGPSLLMEIAAGTESEVFETLVPLMRDWQVIAPAALSISKSGIPTLRRRKPDDHKEAGMIAYLMISAPGKDVREILRRLEEHEPVREAAVVYGESDIVARIVVPEQRDLDALVMDRIHAIPGVESTRTFIVVQDMHWSR